MLRRTKNSQGIPHSSLIGGELPSLVLLTSFGIELETMTVQLFLPRKKKACFCMSHLLEVGMTSCLIHLTTFKNSRSYLLNTLQTWEQPRRPRFSMIGKGLPSFGLFVAFWKQVQPYARATFPPP